ncbi:SpoIIE family protein phosphatase [Nocardia sp. alder85J]|uniref:SpoIIE family protein phosphatase n=1 Tax=Nocardia sp. alder85J TaxID=2862949 RepID=UPI001CD28DBF|nr:SpoIIE family protein phosphatase [Nocardia sp. alder85J]MCX4099178.1 SpoIIE family protein phosphatase [Nocardia sp. alder85J]
MTAADDAPALAPPDRDRSGQPAVTRLAATVERLRAEIQRAQATADGRALLEMAKGVLIERLHCGPAHAARQLEELAARSGVSPLELAAELVDRTAQDELSALVDEFLVRTATPGRSATAVQLRTAESGLLAAGDAHRVARSVLEHAVAPLGATAVALWSAGSDASLTLAGYAGIDAHEAERWRYVPPGVVTPARQALAERQAQWIEDLRASGLPSIGDREGARAAIPAGTGGKLIGVLEVCWPQPLATQPPRVRRQLEALAELCAHTLEPDPAPRNTPDRPDLADLVRLADGLFDPALVLVPRLGDDGITDFRIHHVNRCFVDPAGRPGGLIQGATLFEAYPLAAGEGRLFEQAEHVFATGETYRAERVLLTELVDQVPLTVSAALSIGRHGDTLLMVWRIEDETARLAALLQHAQRLGRVGGFEENAVTGGITWNSQLYLLYGLAPTADPIPLAQLPGHVHADDVEAVRRLLRTLLRYRRPAATAFRLVRPGGETRHLRIVAEPIVDDDGHLLGVRGAYQDISAQHWTEAALSVSQDRLAHTEQHAAEQSRLARQLQQAIMPAATPAIDAFGLRIAVRYQPTEQDHMVGGDWYDAIVLPSKQILISVGDITGHGLEAATGMIVLRNALRGLAATGAGPGQMLTWLNSVTRSLTDHILATAVCCLYDPLTRVLRWARAGHLPPILIRDGTAVTLPALDGMLLGAVEEARYEEAELQLYSDDILLLYTDGLIERRDRPLDECVANLLTASTRFTGTLDDRLDHLLDNSDANADDDTCVVGIQVGLGDSPPR